MRDDDSSAIPALGVGVEIPSPDRLQSLLREAQARALEFTPLPEPTADENLHWDAPPPELVDSLAGFKIIETMDEGGQGIVYKARHDETGHFIAVKVLRNGRLSAPDERRRFEREIQTLAKLNHPSIVKFIPHHNKSAYRYFCMEFIEGEPIDEYVFQRCLSVRDVVQIVVKICDAMQCAHRALVLHRDLKPGNILVTTDGEPHILDFGLSRDLDAEMRGLRSRMSNANQMVGTLVYSAPEQIDKRLGDVDTRTDVYALGLLLYELLAGCKPYPVHGTALEVGESIAKVTPKSLRKIVAATKSDVRWTSGSISEDLECIVLKTLEKEQSRRYESVESLKKDLGRYLCGEAVEARPASYWYVLSRFISRHRWGVGLTAALLIIALGSAITILAVWQRSLSFAKAAQNATMMNTMISNGQALFGSSGPAKAIPEYERALQLAKSSDPTDPVTQTAIFEASHSLAKMLIDQGDIARSLPYLQTAQQIADANYRARPDDIATLRQRALVHSCLASRYLTKAASMKSATAPEYEEARLLYVNNAEKAVAVRRRILELSNGEDRQKLELATAIRELGAILFKSKRFADSLNRLDESREIATTLLTKEPNNVDYSLLLADVEGTIAGAHIKYKVPEQDRIGLEWIERSEKRLDDLQASRNVLYRASDMMNLRNRNAGNKKIVLTREATRQQTSETAVNKSPTTVPNSVSP